MAKPEETSLPQENGPAATAGETGRSRPATPPWWRNLLDPKWLAVFLGLAILVPGMMYALGHLGSPSQTSEPAHGEVRIGEFRFLADSSHRSPIVAATFSLHLALIPEAEALAREKLASHKYRVQQGVEQLLRRARGTDFEDPSLGDLRRQLQEQINETLGIRAVADCIVTDLDLMYSGRDWRQTETGELAGTGPWLD